MGGRQAGRNPGAAGRDDAPVRITTAAESPAKDLRNRQRRYLVSMAIRTVCVVGAVMVGPGPLRWVLVAGAVFLPYVSVVFANATDHKDDAYRLPEADHGFRALDEATRPPRDQGGGRADG